MTAVQIRPQAKNPSSQPTRHYDLIIVGGGIVGLTLASALRSSGLILAVVEAQTPAQAASRERAYAFSLASQEIFKQLGLWSIVSPQITHFDRVCLSDADYPVKVNFRPTHLGTEAVCYAAEHRVLMEALQASLVDCPTIDYLAPATLEAVQHTPNQVQCEITQHDQRWYCTADLMVAADGARSRLRQQADIPTFGWQYWQACITTVLAPEKSHQNTAYERFWPSGPFAILPLPGDRCQIVWTAPQADAEALLQLPPDQFMAELKGRYGDQMGDLKILSKPLMFPVRLMQSRQYVQPRLALVGDAAHCCHPVGGQGLNMGIRDAAALAETLTAANRRGEAIGDLQVLKRYERWRQRENWFILSMTDFLNRTFSNHWLPLVWLRRLGIHLLESVSPLKWLALTIMTGRFGRHPQIPPGEHS
ncbi:MAG: FAD-dependent hydroxylase [Leptolyngbya sp. SIO1D8]|nr:FAD-dependent hydroxylase [Leptolyngbya sp. SIO1D8]